ncbi:MAG TPA: hypothetical protein VGR35_22215 [Tepidisphaeraceae bacterium]|nr:hypothetical protein [Tepidisphaeraceae bacterium]
MPPINQQGSRGALITWSVICSILFVTATIFAIYFYVVANDATTKLSEQEKKYADVVTPAALTGPVVTELQRVRTVPEQAPTLNPSMPALDVAVAQRNALATLIGGPSARPENIIAQARETLATIAKQAKAANLTIPPDGNILLALTTLAGGLEARLDEIAALNKQLAETKQQQIADQQALQAAQKQMEETIAKVRAEANAAIEGVTTYRGEKDADIAAITASATESQRAAQEAIAQRDVQLRERDERLAQLTRDFDALKARFFGQRVDPQNPTIRQADGTIVRTPGGGTVWIDIGQAEGVPPGMTFEVYDKNEGIPVHPTDPQAMDDAPLPIGKASIEVIQVLPTSSQCRVTRVSHGAVISLGDPIVNLVFDKNVKFNFMVYGAFDLDQNGQPSLQDTETIKRLVTSFGGKLIDRVGVDTDFLVLGKEPEIPIIPPEERNDPFQQKRLTEAQAALDEYLDIQRQATELRIPVLNQNRFLYLVGYYNQATR